MLEQLTVDHSIVQELVDAGQITREEADTHPHSNVITRAVGFHEAPIPDYRAIAVEEGMRLLICSDGLTKELTTYGIRHFLVANAKAEKAARPLLDAALGNGGRDNVTVIVVDVAEGRAARTRAGPARAGRPQEPDGCPAPTRRACAQSSPGHPLAALTMGGTGRRRHPGGAEPTGALGGSWPDDCRPPRRTCPASRSSACSDPADSPTCSSTSRTCRAASSP